MFTHMYVYIYVYICVYVYVYIYMCGDFSLQCHDFSEADVGVLNFKLVEALFLIGELKENFKLVEVSNGSFILCLNFLTCHFSCFFNVFSMIFEDLRFFKNFPKFLRWGIPTKAVLI